MRILIIGLGYAGQRYQRAFEYLARVVSDIELQLAYMGRQQKAFALPYFRSVDEALAAFSPHLVVVSANDGAHAEILRQLAGYEGFVLCEKPLTTPRDNLQATCAGLDRLRGFALDLVERYSDAARLLRERVHHENWDLVRASFHWGKDRINDYRPTCGVTSEIIHALDLVGWIARNDGEIELQSVSGVRSDFSISGEAVLDTVMLTATAGGAAITGYSSFVNIQRQRTVDFSFADPSLRLIHARLIFDTPHWDRDQLHIWTRKPNGDIEPIVDFITDPARETEGLETIVKLSKLCEDVVRYIAFGTQPAQPFPDLSTAVRLQELLNKIERQAFAPPPVRYVRGPERPLLPKDIDLESLG
jgi:predicted dehydrogenase